MIVKEKYEARITRYIDVIKINIYTPHVSSFSSFSGKEEGQTEKEKQIDQIYFAYGKKLSPIAEVRYKALDIKDESLGALFEKFHSEMHNIDTMILNALKASFEVSVW